VAWTRVNTPRRSRHFQTNIWDVIKPVGWVQTSVTSCLASPDAGPSAAICPDK
jgi:hypothetical protein